MGVLAGVWIGRETRGRGGERWGEGNGDVMRGMRGEEYSQHTTAKRRDLAPR